MVPLQSIHSTNRFLIVNHNDNAGVNRFTGTIPAEIGDLTGLTALYLCKCWDVMVSFQTVHVTKPFQL